MDASELIIPAACATHALRHIKDAHHDIPCVCDNEDGGRLILNTHLKIIQVSTSCRLFLSAIIWIRSTVITIRQDHTCNRHHDGV